MKYRPPTWEADLAAALDLARDKQFGWWTHDCVTAACRLSGAAMGRNLLGIIKRPWSATTGPLLVATFGGIDGCLDVLGRMAGLHGCLPKKAPRGALVTVRQADGDLRAGCLLGDRVAVVDEAGMRMLLPDLIEAAWADHLD